MDIPDPPEILADYYDILKKTQVHSDEVPEALLKPLTFED